MFSLDLPHRESKVRLRFDWDPSNGTVAGPDGDMVRDWVPGWWSKGLMAGGPWPGGRFRTGNPLTDPRGMFVLINGNGFIAPDWLAAFAPRYRHPKHPPGTVY